MTLIRNDYLPALGRQAVLHHDNGLRQEGGGVCMGVGGWGEGGSSMHQEAACWYAANGYTLNHKPLDARQSFMTMVD